MQQKYKPNPSDFHIDVFSGKILTSVIDSHEICYVHQSAKIVAFPDASESWI